MKNYRLGYDYLFLPKTSFHFYNEKIGAVAINVLFKLFNSDGQEILFDSEQLEDQMFNYEGVTCYLSDLLICSFDNEKGYKFEPNINLLRAFKGTLRFEWETVSFVKVLDKQILEPEIILEHEFLDIVGNYKDLFDNDDNHSAQTTTFFAQDVNDSKLKLAEELLKNTKQDYLKELIDYYIKNIGVIDVIPTGEQDLLRFSDCINYLDEVNYNIKGWMLYEIPVFYSFIFKNTSSNQYFDLAVWDLGEVIPRYLDQFCNEQDAHSIQEAIERYVVPN